MIEIDGLTKQYRSRVAVENLTVTIEPGRVTGLLGPNGSGKTTTMRCVLGVTRPTAGTVTVLGRPYRRLARPMRSVGALLDPAAPHPGRTARAHLLALAQSNAVPAHRVDEVLELVGLDRVARERVRGFSLGMGQRLGIAAALLGDPDVLVLDEPCNALDPEGIRWVRELLRDLAAEGRTVLVSGQVISELEQTADHLVVLGQGRLIADLPMADLLGRNSAVRVRSPMASLLARALERAGARIDVLGDGTLWVEGMDVVEVGDVAFLSGLRVHELTQVTESLEDAYLTLTEGGTGFGGAGFQGAGIDEADFDEFEFQAVPA